MKYIIMADGKGSRWNNYNNIPKHFIEINGERIIERTIRLIKKFDKDCQIIVTSHDKRYDFDGCVRYEPIDNKLEIDRFTYELIEDNICFLYGDTYYTEKSINTIINTIVYDIMFFGNNKSIVAVKVKDSKIFKNHIDVVKNLYLKNQIKDCKGWQVYQSFQNLKFDVKQIKNNFIILDNDTTDYNTPLEYETRKGDKND